MKKFTICNIIFCLLFTIQLCAQNDFKKVDATTKQTILSDISATSKNNKTLSCSFVQEKTSTLVAEKAVSKGLMYYKSPNSLRWEYTSPQTSALIVNGNEAALQTAKGTTTNNTRMFKELATIIISTIDGSGLNDSKNFTSEVLENTTTYKVILTPINKRIAAIYSNITLQIDKQNKVAKSISMQEKNGDSMIIFFSNHKLNQALDTHLFIIQ